MSTPFDDMSEDEMIERILKNEEKIKLYKRVCKTILVVLMLDYVRKERKGKRANKSFRGRSNLNISLSLSKGEERNYLQ